ncbi:hypothetical protein LJY18_08240 [Pseudomonas sp. MMS21-TM103]|uniref:hypothetical protein n=1 Tax=Pseudomonas sp. MMS21 TM103 TaxID=2886506 RepID=UPI001EE0B8BC|nr:hypothetical protein [Pseudomonas sp. MMS21 TM103]MCG4453296.1 hypothetical protein [Pseudomonas sp. MMS21 TM103]
MSDFFSKLEAKRKRAALTESMTIRVTVEEDAAIKELANFYDLTRQDLIHDLIVEYVLPTWRKVETESLAQMAPPPPRDDDNLFHYVLNTNKANCSDDHDAMLSESIAAAFEDGYKEKIDRLRKGDVVFLYESGKGIVAYGWANGLTEERDHFGVPGKTRFQRLENFKILEKPVSAKDICQRLGRNIKFAQTLTYLNDGKKLLESMTG